MANAKTKIGFLTLWFERGQAYVSRAMRGALDGMYETFVFARNGGTTDRPLLRTDGEWAVPNLTAHPDYRVPQDVLTVWIQKHGIEVMIFNEEYDFSLVEAARTAGASTIGYYVWELFDPRWTQQVRSLYDVVICPTRASYQLFRRYGMDNAVYLPWAADAAFQPARLQDDVRPVRFFHPAGWGGMHARRGTDFALEAFRRAKIAGAELHVHCQQGEGEEQEESIRITRGTVPREALVQMYQAADVAVLPSKWEGLGLTFLEALHCGLPILTVDAPPMHEFVRHSETGYLCRAASHGRYPGIFVEGVHIDVADLAAKMQSIAAPATRQAMRENSLRFAERYSETTFKSRLNAIVADVLARCRGGVRLNLGCGTDIRRGYVNCDFRALDGVDRVEDVSRLSYGDGTVSEILANDIIEHFPFARTEEVLREWARVLKEGGLLNLQTPDARALSRALVANQIPVQEFSRRIYGGQTYEGNFHFAGFDLPAMKRRLRTLGLEPEEAQVFNGNMGVKARKITRRKAGSLRITLVSARFTNAPYGTGNFIHKALREMGHGVTDLDFRRDMEQAADILREPADLVLVFKGSGIEPQLYETISCPVVLWYPDDFLQMPHAMNDLTRSGYAFDHVYYFDDFGLQRLQQFGIRHSSFLPLATDPSVYRYVPETPKQYDIVFVGNVYENRRALLERLARKFNVHVAQAYMDEMVELFNAAKIVLNLGIGTSGYQLRIFEALGCRAFLLSNQVRTDKRLFADREHLVYFDENNIEELAGYYLSHAEAREEIAEKGYREVLEKHTFHHRLQTIFRDLGFATDPQPVTAATAPAPKVETYAGLLRAAARETENGDLAAAQRRLEQAVAREPDRVDAHYELAKLQFNQKAYAAAATHFQRVLALDPAEESAWNNCGVCEFHLGHLDAAQEAFEMAKAVHPEAVEARFNAAQAHCRSGDPARAISELNRCLYLNPEFSPAWEKLDGPLKGYAARCDAAPDPPRPPQQRRKKMRVLYLTPPGLGDNPTPETIAADELAKRGHEVTLVRTAENAEIPQAKYDVIYVAMHPSAPAGWRAKEMWRVPIYVHLEGCPWWRIGLDDPVKWGYSEAEAEQIRSQVPHFRKYYRALCEIADAADYRDASFPAHIRAAEFLLDKKLDYPVRSAMFDLRTALAAQCDCEEEYRIVSMTRLVPDKLNHHIAEALKLLDNPPVWSIIGYGPDQEKIQSILKGSRVKVEFMGPMYGKAKFAEIQRAMFGVNLRAGVPPAELLSLDRTNISYYSYIRQIWDEDIVFFARYGDIEHLAEMIQYAIDNPDERRARVQRGKPRLIDGALKTKPAPLFAEILEDRLYQLCA